MKDQGPAKRKIKIPYEELPVIAVRMMDLVKELDLREHALNMVMDGWCVMIEEPKYSDQVMWLQCKDQGKWI